MVWAAGRGAREGFEGCEGSYEEQSEGGDSTTAFLACRVVAQSPGPALPARKVRE